LFPLMEVDMECLSPAKLNLFLRVLQQREDGYHELQTVFQFLDWCDRLYFSRRDDGEVRCHTPMAGVDDRNNLIFRAARILSRITGTHFGVDIWIHKDIPVGAGLGGGSSNAATTLVALNHLWNIGFTMEKLEQIGLKLGADVPVFIRGRSSWAEGIGEKLTPLEPLESWYVLLVPLCSVSTARVFSNERLTRHETKISMSDYSGSYTQNDCAPVTRRLYSHVDKAWTAMAQWLEPRMTGTGSCLFSVCRDRMEAENIALKLEPWGEAKVARGLNQSPLYTRTTGWL